MCVCTGGMGGMITIRSLSKIKEMSLAVIVPVLSSVNFRMYPLPATMLSDRARCPGFSFLSLARRVPGVVSR